MVAGALDQLIEVAQVDAQVQLALAVVLLKRGGHEACKHERNPASVDCDQAHARGVKHQVDVMQDLLQDLKQRFQGAALNSAQVQHAVSWANGAGCG